MRTPGLQPGRLRKGMKDRIPVQCVDNRITLRWRLTCGMGYEYPVLQTALTGINYIFLTSRVRESRFSLTTRCSLKSMLETETISAFHCLHSFTPSSMNY
ncbi:hypothetical protein D3C81_1658560 [compost metagenome]